MEDNLKKLIIPIQIIGTLLFITSLGMALIWDIDLPISVIICAMGPYIIMGFRNISIGRYPLTKKRMMDNITLALSTVSLLAGAYSLALIFFKSRF
jgi:uncharacterized membrane protein